MAKQLQLRRGDTSDHSTFTGALGEVTVDTDKDTVVVHDGSTAGGFPLVTETVAQTLTNKTLTSPTLNSPTLVTPALGTVATGNLSNTAIVFPTGSVKAMYAVNIGSASGSGVMNQDNTTPLVSEGTQIGSIASVVVGSGDKVVCQMCVNLDEYTAGLMTSAFFRDSVCFGSTYSNKNQHDQVNAAYDAPGAGTYTYSYRTGRNTAGSFWYNNTSGGPLFNGTFTSVFTVTVIEG